MAGHLTRRFGPMLANRAMTRLDRTWEPLARGGPHFGEGPDSARLKGGLEEILLRRATCASASTVAKAPFGQHVRMHNKYQGFLEDPEIRLHNIDTVFAILPLATFRHLNNLNIHCIQCQ
jgi:hypothetical protein